MLVVIEHAQQAPILLGKGHRHGQGINRPVDDKHRAAGGLDHLVTVGDDEPREMDVGRMIRHKDGIRDVAVTEFRRVLFRSQRQQALLRVGQALEEAQHQQAQCVAQVEALGSPKERADRDFRKQTIMTCRTLLLENALMAFMTALLGNLQSKVSLACVLHMLLERSGASLETAAEIVYWVNTTGLSLPYRRLLEEVVDGLGAMDLSARGKPIRVGLKDMPP